MLESMKMKAPPISQKFEISQIRKSVSINQILRSLRWLFPSFTWISLTYKMMDPLFGRLHSKKTTPLDGRNAKFSIAYSQMNWNGAIFIYCGVAILIKCSVQLYVRKNATLSHSLLLIIYSLKSIVGSVTMLEMMRTAAILAIAVAILRLRKVW